MENSFSNSLMPLMEYDVEAMLSNNNANVNTNYNIINNNHYLITILQQLTTNHLPSLILHPLGNNLLLHLLQCCHQTLINHLLLSLISSQHHFLSVCLHHIGYRVVVKLISRLRCPSQQWTMALLISPHVFTLAKDFHGGHHVLRSCFQTLSPPPNELIFLRMAQNCLELAREQAGCCILQECIEYSNNKLERLQEVLISPLIQDAHNLSKHRYGNYVIQFMIQLDGANIGGRIIKELRNKFVALSTDKFGSNVVEKCLSCCEAASNDIVFEILESNDHNQDQLIQICTNQYGNYVVQTAISVAKGEAYRSLRKAIKSNWLVLQSHPYGKNVILSLKHDKKKSKSQEL